MFKLNVFSEYSYFYGRVKLFKYFVNIKLQMNKLLTSFKSLSEYIKKEWYNLFKRNRILQFYACLIHIQRMLMIGRS